jgi:tetratricopeptide (TPR) repeat protein
MLLPVWVLAQSSPRPTSQDSTRQRDLALSLETDDTSKPAIAPPRGYALVIGIARYEKLDDSSQLQFPESDAESMRRVLISHEGGAFPAENVHILTGKDARLSDIRRELEQWLPSVAQPTDRVVVYFAGHGFVKNGKGYLAPYDLDPEHLETTGYPMDLLGNVLANRIKARWKVLLTDACHSGRINAETTNEGIDAGFKSLPADFVTLTATTAREKSYEDSNLSTGFGLFTYFLVQAFRGYADTDPCDHLITADELIEYVRTNVRKYARERSVSQTPTASGDYEPDMPLGVSRRECAGNAVAETPMVGTVIIETNMDDTDVYIDGNLVGTATTAKPLVVPGLPSGLHKFEGVVKGYEPDRKEIMVVPGQDRTVTLRIRYQRQIKKAALDKNAEGEKLLFTKRSTLNPLNVVLSRSQSIGDLRKARDLFTQSLKEDPNYGTAAFHLGEVNQLLGDPEAALKAYRQAIQIDPSFVDARRQYAAVLIENGDPDEAIRHLLEGTRLDPNNDEGHSLLARAYWDKGIWAKSIEMADKAIQLKPSNDQAHLWKADALRQLGAVESEPALKRNLYERARESYRTFLNLTNYDSTSFVQWAAFHFVGFGLGGKKHADREVAYRSLRNSGFLGMCLSEQKLGYPLKAREYCQRAIKYDADDAIAHFILGNVYRDLYNANMQCSYLLSARDSYSKMLKLNPDLAEAKNARSYVSQIDEILPSLRCRS